MRHYFIKLALLSILALAAIQALGQQPQSQSPSAPDQTQQPQAERPATAPHVDQEPNPDDRALEQSIKADLKKDPHMTYSNVRVHVTDTQIMLTGTVQNAEAKDQAAKIAGEHAGSRKIENHLKINPNMHPGSGF
ncbi:MAG TPA: BON domain-containing protein [Candidatus Angelobacter sp.]|jgi:osmotically-inducible protein OsmY